MHGLVALMEIQASRLRARTGPGGRAGPALRPEPRAVGPLLIQRGLLALARGEALRRPRGPYLLQAAIAACHARARDAPRTRTGCCITALYDELARLAPSPVVELNRAVAVAMAYGPAAGLELVDRARRRRARSSPIICCRACAATCSTKLGRYDEARGEFERAAALTRNARESAPAARPRRGLRARRH